jgi:hypothetical protein
MGNVDHRRIVMQLATVVPATVGAAPLAARRPPHNGDRMPTAPTIEPQQHQSVRHAPRWHVVLLNDDDHTYEYVMEMLGAVFGHSPETCLLYTSPSPRDH